MRFSETLLVKETCRGRGYGRSWYLTREMAVVKKTDEVQLEIPVGVPIFQSGRTIFRSEKTLAGEHHR